MGDNYVAHGGHWKAYLSLCPSFSGKGIMGIGLTGEIYLQSVMNVLILERVHAFSDGSTGGLNWAQTPNLKVATPVATP